MIIKSKTKQNKNLTADDQFPFSNARRVASRPALSNNVSSFPPVPRAGPFLDAFTFSILAIIALTGHPDVNGGEDRDIDTTYKHAMRICRSLSFFKAAMAKSYGSRNAGVRIAKFRIGRDVAAKCAR
jgi:hypothetical protein